MDQSEIVQIQTHGGQEKSLFARLAEYSRTDDYPMHMPGHKRRARLGVCASDVYAIDITEIPGFDDLHHPEGIIRESLDMTKAYYGSFESFYSVNGSTACVLAALGAAAGKNGRVLAAQNRHWSVDNAAELFGLDMEWIAPERIEALGMDGGVSPERLERMLAADAESGRTPAAVLVVSPSYEGIVSDVRKIAALCKRYGAVLIVDAAHGAHFHYSSRFPEAAGACGADIVIESVHKTLPSMTQTALLHLMKPDTELRDRIKHYLDIFISSSPSYVLMSSIDSCIRYMNSPQAKARTEAYLDVLQETRQRLAELRCLRLLCAAQQKGTNGVFDVDISRISVACCGYMSGQELAELLRVRYHLVMEKAVDTHIIAISTIFDTKEGLVRLADALTEIDHDLLSHGKISKWEGQHL